MFKQKPEKEDFLPLTPIMFEILVEDIANELDVQVTDDLTEALGTAILHLDNRVGRVTFSFLVNCAAKFLANKAAYDTLQPIAEKRKAKDDAAKAKAKAEADAKKVSLEERAPSGVSQ